MGNVFSIILKVDKPFYFAIKTMLEQVSLILLLHLALFFPAVHDPDMSYIVTFLMC